MKKPTMRLLFTAILALNAYPDEVTHLKMIPISDIPKRREAALILYSVDQNNDRTFDIRARKTAYCDALKLLARDIEEKYYWHDEMPPDVLTGIEQHAKTMVAVYYPASETTGCTVVSSLTAIYEIQMLEELIISMASAIYSRSKESDIAVKDEPPLASFHDWINAWNETSARMNLPKQMEEKFDPKSVP